MTKNNQRTWQAKVAAVLFAVCLLSGQSFAQPVGGVQQVGIPSGAMDFVAAAQQNSQWCWAAAIQMVLGYHGVAITQQQIVARTYGTDWRGNLPDWDGSIEAITANLNNWSIDNYGQQYAVTATLNWGAPAPTVLVNELWNRRPMIIGYRSGPNTSHAVVVTAATFSQMMLGPVIHSIVVRDPWPSPANRFSNGRVEYDGESLAQLISAHWFIFVTRSRPPLGQMRPDEAEALALGQAPMQSRVLPALAINYTTTLAPKQLFVASFQPLGSVIQP